MRVHTAERHREPAEALAERLREAWRGAAVAHSEVGVVEPFRESEDGESQYAVCWVRAEVWEVRIHGALWVSFAQQDLATPEVFADAET